jgi:hypothetical protein
MRSNIVDRYFQKVLPEHEQCPRLFSLIEQVRYQAMATNICQHANKHPNARIVVATNRENRPFIRENLMYFCPHLQVKEYFDILDVE